MSKLRAVLFFTVLATLILGLNVQAETGDIAANPNTGSIAFTHVVGTTSQSAVFAAFLSSVPASPGVPAVAGAISLSNILVTPPITPAAGGVGDVFDAIAANSDTVGTLEFYLWDQAGTMTMYETGPLSPGTGLTPAGTLGPGMTYTVLLEEILAEMTGVSGNNFPAGICWVVANSDGVAGTYTVVSFDVGFTQNFNFKPDMGTSLGGNPVSVP